MSVAEFVVWLSRGEILLSQSTLDKLNVDDFFLEKMEPVRVKGKAHPLQLYRLDWMNYQASGIED